MQKLKIFKDFLQRQLALQVFQTNLKHYSDYLAWYLEKGVEMPGQYVFLEGEPLPENKVFIYRFKDTIQRSGLCGRLFNVKGANSKMLSFKCQDLASRQDEFIGQSNVMQYKLLLC